MSEKDKDKVPVDTVNTGLSLLDSTTVEKGEAVSMVPIADGIQPVPARIAQKVESGEYVDFADLLQDQLPADDLSLPPNHSGVVLVQSLETLKCKKKRVIDFCSWAEAFMVYLADDLIRK